MNLQICFMNETASDGSDNEIQKEVFDAKLRIDMLKTNSGMNGGGISSSPYSSLPVTSNLSQPDSQKTPFTEIDFFTQQTKFQLEARTALAQVSGF